MHRVGVALSKLPLMGHMCLLPLLGYPAQILANALIHISDTQFSGESGCQSHSGIMHYLICLFGCVCSDYMILG